MKKLLIDQYMFRQAFDRDEPYHDVDAYLNTAYLNRDTGEIVWVTKDDGNDDSDDTDIANQSLLQQVLSSPEQYIEIPGIDHGKHHEILREFLDSNWTEDEELKDNVRFDYHKSIGLWKKTVGDDIYCVFTDYRDQKTQQMAEEFLGKYGIEPQWKQ